MIFSSFQYLIFLPVVVAIYWRLKDKARLWLLVISSFYFYMSWMPGYGILLFVMSFISWGLGKFIGFYRLRNILKAKWILILGITINLAALCYYKYANFFITNIFAGLKNLGNLVPILHWQNLQTPVYSIILPLGISFFVFEFIHYLVDVYKGSKPVDTLAKFLAFASFFPSQIAGPIKRYQEFEPQLIKPLPWSKQLFYEGMTLIVQGLFKKVVIADPLAWIIAPAYSALAPISALDAWIAFFGFSIQIFCDFSGYTDMGRGSALLMGIRLPINFQLPYLAQDITQFWRRWHISLSSWIRDYIYIPLGGSRQSQWKVKLNLLVTMSVCGLWHGATWQMICWGFVHGVALVVNRSWSTLLERYVSLQHLFNAAIFKVINTLITFMFVVAAFVLFRAENLEHAFNIFSSLLNFQLESYCLELFLKSGVWVFLLTYLVFWLISDLCKRINSIKAEWQLIYPLYLRLAAWTATILFIVAAKPTQATPFIYFQF